MCIRDRPYTYQNGTPVRNWNNAYNGETTIRYAIQQSINVVAVKCLTEITPKLGYDYLLDLGFEHLVDQEVINGQVFSDIGQPMALGGLTYGVTNLELTAAYAAIANKGVYTEPTFYTKILDKDGNIVIDKTQKTRQVFKESTAYLLTSAMQDVVTGGTGTNLKLSNMSVAGKTGTTTNYTDEWFAGFTPYYTCSIWSGYDLSLIHISTLFLLWLPESPHRSQSKDCFHYIWSSEQSTTAWAAASFLRFPEGIHLTSIPPKPAPALPSFPPAPQTLR